LIENLAKQLKIRVRELLLPFGQWAFGESRVIRVQKKLLFVFKIQNCCAARFRAAQP